MHHFYWFFWLIVNDRSHRYSQVKQILLYAGNRVMGIYIFVQSQSGSLTIIFVMCDSFAQFLMKQKHLNLTPIYWPGGDDFIKMDNNHSYSPIGNQNVYVVFFPAWHIVHHSLSVAFSSVIGWLFFWFISRMDLPHNLWLKYEKKKKKNWNNVLSRFKTQAA